MTLTTGMKTLAATALTIVALPLMAHAAGEGPQIERQKWSFAGFFGRFDQNQLQRGFQVYKESCARSPRSSAASSPCSPRS